MFVSSLFGKLHEDSNKVTFKPYIEEPGAQEINQSGLSTIEQSEFFYNLKLFRDRSFFRTIFQGQTYMQYICQDCGKSRPKFENFIPLTLPLPFVFDMNWIFVPFDSNIYSMSHKLMDLPVKEEKLTNGQSNHDLRLLKKRL